MGRKRHNNDKEESDLQKLKAENQTLKRQVSKLKKVINNIDMDHYSFVQDLLNSKDFNDTPIKNTKKEVEKKWSCFKCEEGIMRLMTFSKMGELNYLRKCDCCDNRTKAQPYTEDVEGV